MSWLLLIDGYNVIGPVAPPGGRYDDRWLQRERMQLIERLVKHLEPEIRARSCVVFDAANPPKDRPSQFQYQSVEVRFAVGYPEADDLLEELIASHSAPKTLAVVSSDQRVKTAARRRGCQVFESQEWLDHLLDGNVNLASPVAGGAGQGGEDRCPSDESRSTLADDEVADWMRKFGFCGARCRSRGRNQTAFRFRHGRTKSVENRAPRRLGLRRRWPAESPGLVAAWAGPAGSIGAVCPR